MTNSGYVRESVIRDDVHHVITSFLYVLPLKRNFKGDNTDIGDL